jgi:hypothetical protein
VPDVLAYIQSYDFGTFNDLLWTKTPEEVFATFPYLSAREKSFACRADQWTAFKRDKASRRLTTNSFFLRDGSLPGWAKTPLSRLRAHWRLEPGPGLSAEALAKAEGTRPKIHESFNPGTLARGVRRA